MILVCFGLTASAQKKGGAGTSYLKSVKPQTDLKINFTWGDTFKIPNHYVSLALVGSPNKGVVEIFNREMKAFVLKRHEGKYKTPAVTTVSLDMLPAATTSEVFVTLKGRSFWVYSNWEKESAVERIYAREFDFEHLAFSEQKVLIQFQDKISASEKPFLNTDPRITFTQMDGYKARKYQFALSQDTTRFTIKYTLKSNAADGDKLPETFGLSIFDENLQAVKGGTYTMPYARELMQIVDYQLGPDDEPCFLVKVFDSPQSTPSVEGKQHFEVLRFSGDNRKPNILQIPCEGKSMMSMGIYKNINKEIVCAGIYSQQERGLEEGIYLAKLDLKENVFRSYRKGSYRFPSEQTGANKVVRNPSATKANVKQPESVKTIVHLKDLWFHANGSMTITAEEQAITETLISGKKGKPESERIYHFRNIVMITIDSAGSMTGFKKILKSQSGNEKPGEMSFDLIRSGNDPVLFYMDNPKNVKLRSNQAPAHFTDGAGGIIVCLDIDSSGKETKKILFDSKLKKQMVFPTRFFHLSQTRIMGVAFKEGTETCFFVEIN